MRAIRHVLPLAGSVDARVNKSASPGTRARTSTRVRSPQFTSLRALAPNQACDASAQNSSGFCMQHIGGACLAEIRTPTRHGACRLSPPRLLNLSRVVDVLLLLLGTVVAISMCVHGLAARFVAPEDQQPVG